MPSIQTRLDAIIIPKSDATQLIIYRSWKGISQAKLFNNVTRFLHFQIEFVFLYLTLMVFDFYVFSWNIIVYWIFVEENSIEIPDVVIKIILYILRLEQLLTLSSV